MDSPVDQIKQKIDIVEFIGQFVQLKKAGRNFKACCPFHHEKSPSFVVSADRQIWHCFGSCGTGGDVVSFFMKWEHLTFREALRELAQKVGVQIDTSTYSDDEQQQKDRVATINERAAKYYSYVLNHTPQGVQALEYLTKRGVHTQIIQTFEIGYAPDSWSSLVQYFASKGIPASQLEESGLALRSETGQRVYDRFRDRIIFPIRDSRGLLIGFSGRVLDPDTKAAKYVNTPETALYHKRASLYGIHLTKEAIAKEDNVIIVEGEFDLISPFQNGVSNIVAIKGSALTEEQLSILKRYTNRITLALDTDEAGIEAMKRGIREAEQKDFEIHVVEFSAGKDPDEAVRNDKVSFKKDLAAAVPIYDFLLAHLNSQYPDNSPFHKKKIAEGIAPFLIHIANPIVRAHYVKKVAVLMDVDTQSVERLLMNIKRKTLTGYRNRQTSQPRFTREELIQRYVLSLLFQENDVQHMREVCHLLCTEDFIIPAYGALFEKLNDHITSAPSFDYSQFALLLPQELRVTADELFLYASSINEQNGDATAQIIYELKRTALQHQIQALSSSDDPSADKELTAYTNRLRTLDKNEIAKQLHSV